MESKNIKILKHDRRKKTYVIYRYLHRQDINL